MKEVSCKALDVLFRGARGKADEEAVLVEGVDYSIEHLRNKHERIEWNVYLRILRNARRIWAEDDAFVELGGSFVKSPLFRSIAVVARLFFSPRDFYRWANRTGEGVGNQLFACVEPIAEEVAPDRLALELRVKPGYSVSQEFFLLSKGGLIAMPRLLGLKPATVRMELTNQSARYDITYPKGGRLLARWWKAMTWPLAVRSAAVELKEANEVLQARYVELDRTRAMLASQATRLRTAHSISQVIRRDLDLERTLAAISCAMVEVGGFAEVQVDLKTEVEGLQIERQARHGRRIGEPALERVLENRGRAIGRLSAWCNAVTASDEARELLDFVVPTIAVTLDDSLSYFALAHYRASLEERVTDRTAELTRVRDSLEQTVHSLENAQRAKDRLFANINHEIRTPLSLILLATADLKARGLAVDEQAHRELSGIEFSGRKLLRLVDSLLLLAAGGEGKLQLDPHAYDLAALLQLLITLWKPMAESCGLSLSYRGPASCTWVFDHSAIERVATNLISNAIKFTPHGGTIEIELIEKPTAAQIVVRDTGIGLDAEFRGRVFGRFEQGRAPINGGTQGSGIGLSLVKELVEAHAGSVVAESPGGGGTIFRVTLPASSKGSSLSRPRQPFEQRSSLPADFGLRAPAFERPQVSGLAGGAGRIVLIAEDDPDLLRALAILLQSEYRILTAQDGITALQLAQIHHPDLLISDVNMPGMDGLELARRFRELSTQRVAPVLLLTAMADIPSRLSGFEAGAVDFVTKPFDPEELKARVRAQLEIRALALKLHESEKLATIGMLSTGLAHEIRNPANAIVNAIEPLCELLSREPISLQSPIYELLDVMRECSSQIGFVSRQLLGFRRDGKVERQDALLGKLIARSLSVIEGQLKDIEVRKDLRYEGLLRCSAPLIVQVLTNLLENSAHAAGAGGWIQIASRSEGGQAIIEVADSGPGVPADLREQIFQPFFTTKPPGEGTGLGLTTARDIASRHGGVLEVRTRSSGSYFHLAIPIDQPSPATLPSTESRTIDSTLLPIPRATQL